MAKLRLYLDTRNPDAMNQFPLVIRITSGTSTAHIPLGIKLSEDQWDGQSVINHIQKKVLNNIIMQTFSKYNLALIGLPGTRHMKAKEIKEILCQGEDKVTSKSFFDYSEMYIARKTKLSTREIYEYTINRLKDFSKDKSLCFEDITVSFIKDFDVYLTKSCKMNTRSIHLRNIRSIFNSAIDEEVISQDCYPFRRVKIKTAPTEKRSLTINELKEFIAYTPKYKHQEKYKDIFLLSFYLAGMNIVDLVKLPASDSDILTYTRSKTGIPTEIHIPEEAKVIFERYKGKDYRLDIAEKYKKHKDFLHRMNETLQQIGGIYDIKKKHYSKGLFPELTSYWARHTWATIASELDIPDAVIDMALCHKSPYPMSDIYIRRNRKKVDEAIRKVIDFIKEPEK